MVPVLDQNKVPLMPCTEKRARLMMERKQAKLYWQRGIFCIMLLKKPSSRKYQEVHASVDPGSKREGYTVATKKAVVMNITTNTPDWVKSHVETRRNLRRARRQRKTPYRACRSNRSSLSNKRIPPSTKARWGVKLRIIHQLMKIVPVTHVNVEDIQAVTKKGKGRWNRSFSPLQMGKNWFYSEVQKLAVVLIKTLGIKTSRHRKSRGFVKSKKKLEYIWEAHNSDSHSLVEISMGCKVKPYKGIYSVEFLQYYRRQLHVQNPIKGNVRKPYGGTVSLGMSRGSVVRHSKDGKLYYLGGESKGKVAIHSIVTGKRIKQFVNSKNIKIMYCTKQRAQFLPRVNQWVSLRILG